MSETIHTVNTWTSIVNAAVSRVSPVGGILTGQAAIVTQSGSSSLHILNNEGVAVTAIPNVSISAPTLAYFAKVGTWIATIGKVAGVAVPGVGLVALGMTVISATAAAASNE